MTEEDQKNLSFRQLSKLAEKKGDFCLLDYFPNVMVSFCFKGSEVGIPLKIILEKYSEFLQKPSFRDFDSLPGTTIMGVYKIVDINNPLKKLRKWISDYVKKEQETEEWIRLLTLDLSERLLPRFGFDPLILRSKTQPLAARDYSAAFLAGLQFTKSSFMTISKFVIPDPKA